MLSRRTVTEREFGPWDMAARSPGEGGEAFVARVGGLVANAGADVRATFDGFARIDRAA